MRSRFANYTSPAASGNDAARRAINRWVAGRRYDKIAALIPQSVLDASICLVLTNAIYLNVAWAESLDPTHA